MVLNTRISYSQVRTYGECGRKYELHYKEKLREATKSSALLFGTAMDKAIESVLQKQSVDGKDFFDKLWTNQDINKQDIYLPDSLLVTYSNSDYDHDILHPEDIKFIKAKCVEYFGHDKYIAAYIECFASKKQKEYKHFPEEQNKFLNLVCWFSLRRKGHLMLEAHREKILPNIIEVLQTQAPTDLTNEAGDSLIGYADLVCIWKDGRKIIFDYKTSAQGYEKGAVLESDQLSIYSYALSIKTCGFIVFKKSIIKNRVKICKSCGFDGTNARQTTCFNELDGKRCKGEWTETIRPEAGIQVLIDDIPESIKDIVVSKVNTTNDSIKAGEFPQNFDSCRQPWGACPYFEICHKDDYSKVVKVD